MAKTLRVLIAGCGNMGASHARAYYKMPEFEVVGLVSRGPTSRNALSLELGGLPEFSDYYDALSTTKPDVVSINTYPETHAPYAKAAIQAGCHVFCEKPLATSVEEARPLSMPHARAIASSSSATSCASTRPGSGSSRSRGRSASPWSCA